MIIHVVISKLFVKIHITVDIIKESFKNFILKCTIFIHFLKILYRKNIKTINAFIKYKYAKISKIFSLTHTHTHKIYYIAVKFSGVKFSCV